MRDVDSPAAASRMALPSLGQFYPALSFRRQHLAGFFEGRQEEVRGDVEEVCELNDEVDLRDRHAIAKAINLRLRHREVRRLFCEQHQQLLRGHGPEIAGAGYALLVPAAKLK